MQFENIPLWQLVVNPDNDRHGPQGSEQDAVSWLFEHHGNAMMTLIDDIVEQKEIFDPPLVVRDGGVFVVFDGNRRVTALKTLAGLLEAPEPFGTKLLEYKKRFSPTRDYSLGCQIEGRSDVVDKILSRRHNGTDNGRGQLRWDTEAKANHASRVGGTKYYGISVAIEKYLEKIGYKPSKKFKRSIIYRLVNTNARQALFGIKVNASGELVFTRSEQQARKALLKLADDAAADVLTLKNTLDKESIEKYLETIGEYLAPNEIKLEPLNDKSPLNSSKGRRRVVGSAPKRRNNLISREIDYSQYWKRERLGKIQGVWQELQYHLQLDIHPISIAIVFRTLIELITNFSLHELGLPSEKTLSSNVVKLAQLLGESGAIPPKGNADVARFALDKQSNRGLESLHRVVHGQGVTISSVDLLVTCPPVVPRS